MRRVVWVVTIAVLAALGTAQKKRPGFDAQPSWTWAQVVQGAADNPKTVPHRPLTQDFKPYSYGDNPKPSPHRPLTQDLNKPSSYGDDANYDNRYDGEDQFPNENDLVKNDDYIYVDYIDDDEQFKNDDYIYVDDIDDVENQEEYQFKNENANRRVLDFLYHTFAQPVLQPDQPAQNSLIGEIFHTIDNHIQKDFTSLANLISQGTATATPGAQQPEYGTPVATSIAAGPTADDFLVTDDLGNQHLVSVDDIVQSLSVLDERSLVDLILAPEGAAPDPLLSIQLPPGNQINRAPDLPATQTASAPLNSFQLPAPAPAPLPVSVTPSSGSPINGGVPLPSIQNLPAVQQNVVDTNEVLVLPAQLTKAIRNAAATHGGEVFRPVRHTGPANSATSDDEESFLITDEQGNVQIITMNDILSSLTNLDEESLTSLLRETQAEADSIIRQSQTDSNSTSSPNLIDIPSSVPASIAASPPAPPLIETDYQGHVHIRPSQSGSIKIDLNDHTAEHSKLKEPTFPTVVSTSPAAAPAPPSPPPTPPQSSPTKNKTVISSDGTQVSTDQDGNIYITPDPDRPFTLDIQNIIRLAERAEQGQTPEDKASEFSGAIVNQLPNTKTSTPTPISDIPERGNQILAYLAGVENFLPNPILPGPLRPGEPEQPVQPQVPDFRTALLNTLRQQSQPLRLHAQPEQQTTPAPATPGIGAQLSGLLSRIVNQARQVVGSQPVPPVPEPQDEVIQLVIREQFEDGGEEIYGNINVPLPQGIHHSKEALQKLKQQGNRNSGNTNEAQRRQDTVTNWQDAIPKSVLEAVLRGMHVEPTFDITKAVQRPVSPLVQANLISQVYSDSAAKKSENKFDPNKISQYISDSAGKNEIIFEPPVTADERGSHFQVSYDSHDSGHGSPPHPQPDYAPGPAPQPDYAPGPAPQPNYAPQPAPQPIEYGPPQTIFESKPIPYEPSYHEPSYNEPSYHEPSYHEPSYHEPSYHEKLPLFDLYLLADFNKAKKLGADHDGSIGAPLIGDPSYFVDTKHKHHY